jgi:hypothetical protein
MKLTSQLHVVPRLRMMEPYYHSAILLNDVVLNYSQRVSLRLPYLITVKCLKKMIPLFF